MNFKYRRCTYEYKLYEILYMQLQDYNYYWIIMY